MSCRSHVALWRGIEKSLSERHGRGMARAGQARGRACLNQPRPHCVTQMGKTQSTPLAARHDRGMAQARHGNDRVCELALSVWMYTYPEPLSVSEIFWAPENDIIRRSVETQNCDKERRMRDMAWCLEVASANQRAGRESHHFNC
jgi:hypothetical protein